MTNQTLQLEALSGIRDAREAMEDARRRASSGRRVRRPSDDPVATAGILSSSSRLRGVEQYKKNLNAARSRLELEDEILDQLSDALTRARELGLSQADSSATAATRKTALAEVETIRESVRALGNTRFAGSYLFGGAWSETRPFPPGGPDPSRPPRGDHVVEGGAGRRMSANHSGARIFMDTGVLSSLEELSDALAADDPEAIRIATSSLDGAQDQVQAVVGELGARMNQVDSALENLNSLETNLLSFRSELEDAELDRAVTELVARQSAFQAALSANARILDNSLTDYLR